MNLGRFLWGLILIFIGGIFLLINYNVLDPSVWAQIWKLWPLAIIIIGLSIISRGASKAMQVILSITAIIVLIIALIVAIRPAYLCSGDTCKLTDDLRLESTNLEQKTIAEAPQDGAETAKVVIETGAADLNISGGSNLLVEGNIESTRSTPSISRQMTDNNDKVVISSQFDRRGFWFGSFTNNWDLALNKTLPLSLAINSGAVDAKVDLSDTNLTDLDIQTGASSYQLTFPEKEGLIQSTISAGASSFKISIPKNTKVKVTTETGLTSVDFKGMKLQKTDNTYQSDGYEEANSKIDLTLKTGVSSIEIEQR